MNDGPLTLRTRLEPMGPACALILTDEQVDSLRGGKRAPVQVTIGGRTARLRLAVMGGQNVIGLSKAARAELGVEIGQDVSAEIALDSQPREVEVPAELSDALGADSAAAFEGLTFTHRREFASWVGEAKRPETRVRRAEQAVQMLREGKTRS